MLELAALQDGMAAASSTVMPITLDHRLLSPAMVRPLAITLTLLMGLATACGDDGTPLVDDSTTDQTTTGSHDPTDSTADGSTTGAPACAPAADGGIGLAYLGAPEPGVRCADEVCPFGCDQRFVPSCNPDAEADDYGADAYCDGPEDCAQAEVCCVTEVGDAFDRTTSVCVDAATCPAGARRVCNGDADCDGEHCIRGYTNGGALDIGACRAEPPSACTALPEADCAGASLPGMDLDGMDLHDANLCQADLSDAVLREALLDGAVLTDAILTNARLNGASLREADLSGADLRYAVFHDADLTGADLTGAQLEGTLGANVTCPDGTLSNLLQSSLCEGKLDP